MKFSSPQTPEETTDRIRDLRSTMRQQVEMFSSINPESLEEPAADHSSVMSGADLSEIQSEQAQQNNQDRIARVMICLQKRTLTLEHMELLVALKAKGVISGENQDQALHSDSDTAEKLTEQI